MFDFKNQTGGVDFPALGGVMQGGANAANAAPAMNNDAAPGAASANPSTGQPTSTTQQMSEKQMAMKKGGGALAGASTGASIGSMAGPWGTAIGSVIGGLLGAFGG